MSEETPIPAGETRRSRGADAVFALAMIGAAIATLVELRKQPRSPFDPVGAAAIPSWTAWIVIALAALLLLRLVFGRATAGAAQSLFVGIVDQAGLDYRLRPALALATFALTVAYAAVMPLIGFLAATACYLLALGWLLCDRKPVSLVVTGAIALLGSVAIDWVFRRILYVPLP